MTQLDDATTAITAIDVCGRMDRQTAGTTRVKLTRLLFVACCQPTDVTTTRPICVTLPRGGGATFQISPRVKTLLP